MEAWAMMMETMVSLLAPGWPMNLPQLEMATGWDLGPMNRSP
jgi:hypothetical protein